MKKNQKESSEIIYKIVKLNLEKKIIQTEIDILIDSLIDEEVEILINKLHGEENENGEENEKRTNKDRK